MEVYLSQQAGQHGGVMSAFSLSDQVKKMDTLTETVYLFVKDGILASVTVSPDSSAAVASRRVSGPDAPY